MFESCSGGFKFNEIGARGRIRGITNGATDRRCTDNGAARTGIRASRLASTIAYPDVHGV